MNRKEKYADWVIPRCNSGYYSSHREMDWRIVRKFRGEKIISNFSSQEHWWNTADIIFKRIFKNSIESFNFLVLFGFWNIDFDLRSAETTFKVKTYQGEINAEMMAKE